MSLLDRTSGTAQPTLTDRYLDAVARDVPHNRREGVREQVRESLDVDVTRRVADGTPASQAERQALEALGDPRRVADEACGPRWLIGPRVYPDYVRVLRLVVVVVLPIVATSVAIADGLAGQNPAEVLLSAVTAAAGAAVQCAFWVTLVFAVLDRTGAALHSRAGAWTVADLPAPAARKARVGLGETITSVIFGVLLIGVVLWPWQYVPSAGAQGVPVLSDDLRPTVTALLVAVLVAGIALDVVLYLLGRWTLPLAAVNTVLDVAFAGVVIGLVASDRLFDPAFVAALGQGPVFDAAQAADVVAAAGTGIAWSVGLVCAADAVSGWVKAARAQPHGRP